MEIKVGDKVTSNDPELAGIVGTVIKVRDVDQEFYVDFSPKAFGNIYDKNGKRNKICGSDQLTLVEEPIFKIGDRVKSSDPSLGIGTVREYTYSRVGYTVDYPSYRGASYVADGTRFEEFGTDKITLFEDKKETAPQYTFKVGDTVKSSDPRLGTGRIKRLAESSAGFIVEYPTYKGAWYMPDGTRKPELGKDKVTLVEEKKVEEVKMGFAMGEPAERVSKYKVGDKVRVRSDLSVRRYGNDSAVSEMLSMRGKIVTISLVVTEGKYHILETTWNWTDEMFEDSVVQPTMTTLIYVRFGHDDKTFLFSVASDSTITDGTKVYVKTKRAERSVATAVGDTFKVNDSALKNICKGAGITVESLQPVIGFAVEKKTYDFKPL